MSLTATTRFAIRLAHAADEPFLWEMLYHSLYVEEGAAPFPRTVTQQPEIARYVKEWGRAGDLAFIAVEVSNNTLVGAAWCRLFRGDDQGYAFVDEQTPELGIAVLPQYRGRGIGSALLAQLLSKAEKHYRAISLSVSPDNPAKRLYERFGFETIAVSNGSHIMRRCFRA